MYSSQRAQISHLKANEAFIEVFSKYADFAHVFLPKLTIKLPKDMDINNHVIELVDD